MCGAYALHPLNFSFEIFIGSVGKNQFFYNGVFFCLKADRRIQSTAVVQRKIELCGLPFPAGLTARGGSAGSGASSRRRW